MNEPVREVLVDVLALEAWLPHGDAACARGPARIGECDALAALAGQR